MGRLCGRFFNWTGFGESQFLPQRHRESSQRHRGSVALEYVDGATDAKGAKDTKDAKIIAVFLVVSPLIWAKPQQKKTYSS